MVKEYTKHKKAKFHIEQLASIGDASFEGIIITDKNGIIQYVNHAWEKATGWKKKEVIGKVTSRILKSDIHNKEFYKKLWKTITSGKTFRAELTNKRKDGTSYTSDNVIFPMKGADGNISYVEVSRDMTDRKKAEERRQEIEKLKELDKLKTQFFIFTAHELKNPITPIVLQTQMLLEGSLGKLSKKQKKSVSIIFRSMKRLDKLVWGILEFSRVQNRIMELHVKKMQIADVIKETIESMRPSANQKKIKLTTKIGKLPKSTFDSERISQVLLNLIDNAIKFTPTKGKITIKAAKNKEAIVIRVEDTGIGVPKESVNKIFEPLFQVRSPYTKKKGLGLGLAICKGIIEQHGGKIWVGSVLRKGSTFSFTLPLKTEKSK